jgi:hypothetical protein
MFDFVITVIGGLLALLLAWFGFCVLVAMVVFPVMALGQLGEWISGLKRSPLPKPKPLSLVEQYDLLPSHCFDCGRYGPYCKYCHRCGSCCLCDGPPTFARRGMLATSVEPVSVSLSPSTPVAPSGNGVCVHCGCYTVNLCPDCHFCRRLCCKCPKQKNVVAN